MSFSVDCSVETDPTSISSSGSLTPCSTSSDKHIFDQFCSQVLTVTMLKDLLSVSIERLVSLVSEYATTLTISTAYSVWIRLSLYFKLFAPAHIHLLSLPYNVSRWQPYLDNVIQMWSSGGWDAPEIESLYTLSLMGLSAKDIHSQMPSTPVKKVAEAINQLEYSTWTASEITILESLAPESLNTAHTLLPCRSQSEIEKTWEDLALSGHDFTSSSYESRLNECIKLDLTATNLCQTFPLIPIEYTVAHLTTLELPAELTLGEKHTLKNLITNGDGIENVYYSLPCRGKEYLDTKFKEMAYVSSRKTKFKSLEERLLYEAKWVMFTSGSDALQGRRRRKVYQDLDKLEKDLEESRANTKKIRAELSPDELAERARRKELRNKLLEEKRERKRLQRELAKKQAEMYKIKGSSRSPKDGPSASLRSLLAGSEHFQSVIGDKQKVADGQKRRRIQADHYQPEIDTPTPKLKARPRELEKKELIRKTKEHQAEVKKPKKTHSKRLKLPVKKEAVDSVSKTSTDSRSSTPKSDDEDEDYVSPFDPTSINADTQIPLNGRHLFEPGFYKDKPEITSLKYVSSSENIPQPNDLIAVNDNLAASIIESHHKNYRSLPISFPSLYEDGSIDLRNRVSVRFLVHPRHYESFILAAPKSNELDPIYEIIKLFMIHYTLYFSHSEEIKQIINEDYCEALEKSVDMNDFGKFMFVIDKWNSLMLHLSPNEDELDYLDKNGSDINSEIRQFLGPEEVKVPTIEDLKLEVFYKMITLEDPSPPFNPVDKSGRYFEESKSKDGVEVPTTVSDTMTDLKPPDYRSCFFARLAKMTSVSRFTMQQILLRVYSRVVSTDSRKLRSYKAFTAEVYGELLPSFTSEVLEKVQLKPDQKFYDLGSGVGNTTFQASLEFGACVSGGCELMDHASKLTKLQEGLLQKHLAVLGLKRLELNFALSQSFVDNEQVRSSVLDCDVLIINNYLFDANLNNDVGKLLYGLRPGTKIISLRNFIGRRYKAQGDTIFDRLKVEMHEMSDFLSVSWTANKVPYYISTVQEHILPEYLGKDETPEAFNAPELKLENAPFDDKYGNCTTVVTH